ncbi:MAG TPA: hypothetical protein VLX56_08320 [Nitrososphaerales archaeon]|nr:hypothetical protein [Nitrososphaerales archaeon]
MEVRYRAPHVRLFARAFAAVTTMTTTTAALFFVYRMPDPS